jgi:hypothetical protein
MTATVSDDDETSDLRNLPDDVRRNIDSLIEGGKAFLVTEPDTGRQLLSMQAGGRQGTFEMRKAGLRRIA